MTVAKITDFRSDEPEPVKKRNSKPEDGEFFRFAWRVSEALYQTDFSKVQHRLIHYVIRKTWGWNKATFIFCITKAAQEMGLPKQHIWKAYHELIKADVFKTERGEIGLNKYSEEWNLTFLKETRTQETERRRKQVTDLVTEPGNESRYSPVTNLVTPVTDLVTETPLKPAQSNDLSESYRHYFIDKEIDIPPKSPKGDGLEDSSMPTKYEPLHRFDDWYNHYPKKKSRGAAEKAWTKLTKLKEFNDAFVDRLIEAIAMHKRLDGSWKRGFIPNPATWLNGKEWLNEYDGKPPTAAGRQSADDVVNAWLKGAGD